MIPSPYPSTTSSVDDAVEYARLNRSLLESFFFVSTSCCQSTVEMLLFRRTRDEGRYYDQVIFEFVIFWICSVQSIESFYYVWWFIKCEFLEISSCGFYFLIIHFIFFSLFIDFPSFSFFSSSKDISSESSSQYGTAASYYSSDRSDSSSSSDSGIMDGLR